MMTRDKVIFSHGTTLGWAADSVGVEVFFSANLVPYETLPGALMLYIRPRIEPTVTVSVGDQLAAGTANT